MLPVPLHVQYTRGKEPGDYIIIAAFKKDQRINNVTYTTRPSAAVPLPLPVDPVLHQKQLSSQQETIVGIVRRRESMAVLLWNQRQGSCNRPHALLLSPRDAAAAAGGAAAGSTKMSGAVNWAPGQLDLSIIIPSTSAPEAAAAAATAAETRAAPGSAAAASTRSDWGVRPNTTLLDPLPAADAISTTWPPPGGQVIECPVEMRGNSQAVNGSQVVVDVGFGAGLFRVEESHATGETLFIKLLHVCLSYSMRGGIMFFPAGCHRVAK
jgi:hypothetical protein